MSAAARPAPAALAAMHEEEALGKAYDARLLARLWPYARPHRWPMFATLALVPPLFVLQLAPGWLIKTGIDRVMTPGAGATTGPAALERLLTAPGELSALVWLAGLYLTVMVLLSALEYLRSVLLTQTGHAAMRELRADVFSHIQRLHLGFFDRYPVGRLVTRATNDVENVAEMFSAGIVLLVTDLLVIVGIAAMLFLVNPDLALVTFAVVPVLALAAIVFRLRVREAFRKVRVRIARINTYLQEAITGMKVVQLFTRERRNLRDFEDLNADHRDAWFESIRYDSALFAVVEFAQYLTVAIVIWQATGLAELGEIYLFIEWMRRFFLPLRDLSNKYSVMQSSMASCERIVQLLDTEPEIRDAPPTARLAPAPRSAAAPAEAGAPRGAVEFEDVWFSYSGAPEEAVLKGVSFRVEPGERVAFVGATGAGKTTIIKLLTRFYEATRGRILLDGVDLRELPQAELRARVAMVLQDVFLFSGSVADNIALGREDIGEDEIRRAARAVEAHRFIEALPRGYATELRERGSDLSAGQRQLLSFARALAHGADVLVLDEATSSIDTETEALVQQGIHVLMEGKTALVIAHRLSTIEDVDRIYVLHHGKVVEQGRHDELLAKGGLYSRLHRLQAF